MAAITTNLFKSRIQNKEAFKAYLALAAVSFFWGTTYLAVRVGVQEIPALSLAAMRQTLAGLLLCSFFLYNGHPLPRGKELKRIIVVGLLSIMAANSLTTWAAQYLPSGTSALLASLMPLMVLGFTWFYDRHTRINAAIWGGILASSVGLVLIFLDQLKQLTKPEYMAGMLMVIVANFLGGGTMVYTKKFIHQTQPAFMSGLQMLSSGILMSGMAFWAEDPTKISFEWKGITALLYLVVFGSVVGFSALMYALRKLPAPVVSLYIYINPLIAVLLGWLVLDESLTVMILAAFVLILSGVYIVNKYYRLLNR